MTKCFYAGFAGDGMRMGQRSRLVADLVVVLACALGMAACQPGFVAMEEQQPETQGANAAQTGTEIVIENDSDLPDTSPHAPYQQRFRAHGTVGVQHWKLLKGTLPPGMKLEDDGLLHGQAEHSGEFWFTVAVTDARPQPGVQKEFVLRVRSALTLKWKTPARVNGKRIEGSAEVSNTTPDDMDLTFIVLAVAENGRATAIGYQHFVLQRGTIAKELPFGETLPPGGYVVHVDAVGEVEQKNVIYRERLQTPSALQVTLGP
jgi:hypothetical protein